MVKHIWEKSYPTGLDWHTPIDTPTLPDFFDHQAIKHHDRIFLNFLGREWSYSDSRKMVDQIAAGLQEIGVKKGIKVGLFLPNTPYSVWFFYGILKAGGTVVNYNPLYTQSELTHQVEDSETDIIITADLEMLCDKMDDLLASTRLQKLVICPFSEILPFPKNILFSLFKRKDIAKIDWSDKRFIKFEAMTYSQHVWNPPKIDAVNDVAVLQYTGGTTGRPKGAMLTHQNIYSNAAQVSLWISELTRPNVQMSVVGVLPFFHVFAMTAVMNMGIYHGMRILLQPNFELDKVLKLIDQEKPDFFAGVPAIYNAIAKHPDVEKYDFSSLQYCISGGAPLPKEVQKRFADKTGCPWLSQGYGLTESSPVATVNPVRDGMTVDTIGLPVPQTLVEIINQDDGVTPMPIGEKGEVCITGPQVMKGYFNKPDETAKTIKNGRLHTGDIGFMDVNGYVTLVDRIKDLILVRGYNVYPSQVEDAIYKHPSVEEAIVAGVPDEERGETVWAWIKPREGRSVSEEDIKTFLKDHVSPIELPRKVIIRDKPLPKTDVGKLSRKMLLEQEGIKK